MARRKDQQAVTAKMYRRFAVVTLMATAALAFASDEDNADKLNAEVATTQAEIAAAGKKIQQENQATVIRRTSIEHKPAASGWGSDEGGGSSTSGSRGGSASAGYRGSAATPYAGQRTPGVVVSPEMLRKLKMTQEQFLALPYPEQQRLISGPANSPAEPYVSPAQAARTEQTVSNASLTRSGFSGPCNDC